MHWRTLSGLWAEEYGASIMDVVMATALAGLAGTILFAGWVFTLGFAKQGRADLQTQQMARIALATVTRELRESAASRDAIVIWSTEQGDPVDAIGFPSARPEPGGPVGVAEGGGPSWQRIVYFVHDRPAQMLRRQSVSWQDTLAPPSADAGRVVARGVSAVRFAWQEDLILITLRIATARGDLTWDTAIRPRN